MRDPFDRYEVEAYFAAHASLRIHLVAGMSLRLTVNNLFDADYEHPGVRSADGVNFARLLPQPGRAAYLQLSVSR